MYVSKFSLKHLAEILNLRVPVAPKKCRIFSASPGEVWYCSMTRKYSYAVHNVRVRLCLSNGPYKTRVINLSEIPLRPQIHLRVQPLISTYLPFFYPLLLVSPAQSKESTGIGGGGHVTHIGGREPALCKL